jgi:hypothetical protein
MEMTVNHAHTLCTKGAANMIQPSSQVPCICPEGAWRNDCPRHEHMQDTWDFDPFRSRVEEDAHFNGAQPS